MSEKETQALNEELSAANEEITAANDELTNINDELLDARERLALANESLEQKVAERTKALQQSEEESTGIERRTGGNQRRAIDH